MASGGGGPVLRGVVIVGDRGFGVGGEHFVGRVGGAQGGDHDLARVGDPPIDGAADGGAREHGFSVERDAHEADDLLGTLLAHVDLGLPRDEAAALQHPDRRRRAVHRPRQCGQLRRAPARRELFEQRPLAQAEAVQLGRLERLPQALRGAPSAVAERDPRGGRGATPGREQQAHRLAERREVVLRHPTRERDQLGVEARRIHHLAHRLEPPSVPGRSARLDRRRDGEDHAFEAARAERHPHASAGRERHRLRHRVGEGAWHRRHHRDLGDPLGRRGRQRGQRLAVRARHAGQASTLPRGRRTERAFFRRGQRTQAGGARAQPWRSSSSRIRASTPGRRSSRRSA